MLLLCVGVARVLARLALLLPLPCVIGYCCCLLLHERVVSVGEICISSFRVLTDSWSSVLSAVSRCCMYRTAASLLLQLLPMLYISYCCYSLLLQLPLMLYVSYCCYSLLLQLLLHDVLMLRRAGIHPITGRPGGLVVTLECCERWSLSSIPTVVRFDFICKNA